MLRISLARDAILVLLLCSLLGLEISVDAFTNNIKPLINRNNAQLSKPTHITSKKNAPLTRSKSMNLFGGEKDDKEDEDDGKKIEIEVKDSEKSAPTPFFAATEEAVLDNNDTPTVEYTNEKNEVEISSEKAESSNIVTSNDASTASSSDTNEKIDTEEEETPKQQQKSESELETVAAESEAAAVETKPKETTTIEVVNDGVLEKDTVSTTPEPEVVEDAAVKRARDLRAQAERARLEAEKMDAELTLQKITKLEKEMATARAKDKTDTLADLQREMEGLQAKLRGEAPKPVIIPKPSASTTSTIATSSSVQSTTTKTTGGEGLSSTEPKKEIAVFEADGTKIVMKGPALKPELKPFQQKDFEAILEELENSPKFFQKLMASIVELDYDTIDSLNTTELAVRIEKIQRMDFSYSNLPEPSFTAEDIERAKMELSANKEWLTDAMFNLDVLESAKGNDTALALIVLEYEYYTQGSNAITEESFAQFIAEEDWLKEIVDAVNKSIVDRSIEQLYPKCVYNRDDQVLPKLESIQRLVSDVLPQAKFSTFGTPEQVLGGYIIRGTHTYENGDDLISAIDAQLAKKSAMNDEMTVLYTNDFSIFADLEESFDTGAVDIDILEERQPILFVTAKNICRKPRRVALSLVSAFGFATTWYLSLYPFLLNGVIMDRVNQQLDLANAGMEADLAWLTDLSIPLFLTFIGIQILHETSHIVVSKLYDFKVTAPTFVPSLLTGITSSVTTFKEPPKNREAMFDFSLSGPMVGMLASIAALVVGSQLTAYSPSATAALFPALPLEILRQSTLGGGIIDSILGNGALSVPDGALGTQAVAGMTIPLHPIAIAGYIGLIVNALCVLPIGTTDGGRVAQTLFGREAKSVIGNLTLFALLLGGLFGGSDLFLFYFSFVIAFQTGNEIPPRNEVDTVSFSRVIASATAYVLAALVLIPFQ